ncbi:MAG: SigE family RNA polymerase sigma factor, partial [Mycobacteriales bacterium]|nr:SigE family RNA polymerase sigma factor [Frankia sp.]
MAVRRDREFESFVAARGSALLRFAIGVTGDRHTAEDVLQVALAKAYVAWWRIRQADAREAYVRRVIVRSAVSWWRRHGRERAELIDDLPAAPDPRDAMGDVEERDETWRALAGLGRRQRAVVVLRYYEDRTDHEIAALLGCSESTVRSQA